MSTIHGTREFLAAQLKGLDCPVWTFKPDDLTEVPCVVVDKPTLTINVQLMEVTCSVIVIGRRTNDEDAQTELDDLAEAAMLALRGPDVNVSLVEPIQVTVAELNHPGYRIECAVGQIDCYL